jgi:hypothetical protein
MTYADLLTTSSANIAKCMGTHFQIHGVPFPNTRGNIAKYMGTCCQHEIYVQHVEDRLLLQMNIYGISLITMHGMRAGVHSTLGSNPDNLVFNRDRFLNIPLIADWHASHKDENILSMRTS